MTNEWILYTDYLEQCRKFNSEAQRFWHQSAMKLEFMYDAKIFNNKNGGHVITETHISNDINYSEKYGHPRKYTDSDLGKIEVYVGWNDDADDCVWERLDPTKYYVRVVPKLFDKYMKVKELIQVGDFVRFSGSNRRYAWRKVLEIKDNTIFGQCASHPKEEALVFHTSDNGILTAMEIIRNGQKIF